MAAAKRKSIAKLCIALGLFVLAGFFRQLDRVTAPLPSSACFLLTNLIYIGLAMAWGFSISRRILHRNDRRWLLLGCAMAMLWLFLRAVKYRFFSNDTITRHLWYGYYVPQILAPLFSLFAALQLGRREDDALSRKWVLLFVPAALLIGGVLTNDLHQMAFRAAPGAATLEADYTHGWVYYLAMTWIVGLLLATGIIVYRKCRVSESRRFAWAPLCVFPGGFVLCEFELREYLHLPQDAGMLLPDVCGVLGELPAGGAAADQRPLPPFLFRIHSRRADCGRARNACVSRKKCARSHAESAGSGGARSDSPERGHAAAKRAGAGWARILGGGHFRKSIESGRSLPRLTCSFRRKTN